MIFIIPYGVAVGWPAFDADFSDDVILILTRKLLVHPQELLAFVHHADETTKARVFGFEQSVEVVMSVFWG